MVRNSRPLFTAIINNYNYGWCLPQAVASIISQTFRDFELIIVDDGSTDDSVDYIQALSFPHTFVQTPNLRQSGACLQALKMSQGRYIFFLDADDFACPTLFARVAAELSKSPAKIQFRLQPVDKHGSNIYGPFPSYPRSYTSEQIIREIQLRGGYTFPPTSGNVFRRDILEFIGEINYEHAIDGITALIAPYHGQVVSLDDVLACYRVHNTSHSGHSHPSDPMTVRRDIERFAHRIRHLHALLSAYAPSSNKLKPGEFYLFTHDQKTIEEVLSGRRISLPLACRFLHRLVIERGFGMYTLRKLGWLFIALFAPNHVAQRVAISRRTPWGRQSPTPSAHASR